MLQGRTPLATMNRFYSLQTRSRKRSRTNKRTKDILRDDSIEPNYPRCISFDSLEQDKHLPTNEYISYPTNSMDDDQLSVLTEDRNRNRETDFSSKSLLQGDCCHMSDSDASYSIEKLDLFLTSSGKMVTKVKNYPFLFYDPTHPTMTEILKNHFASI